MSDETLEGLINWICALNEEQRELLRHNIYSVSRTRGNGFKMIHMYIWLILKHLQNYKAVPSCTEIYKEIQNVTI